MEIGVVLLKKFILSLLLVVLVFPTFVTVSASQSDDIIDWAQIGNMDAVESKNSAVAIDGLIYIAGGMKGTQEINDLKVYNPLTKQWTNKTSMRTAKSSYVAETVNGKLYIISGVVNNSTTITKVVEEYDPVTDIWTTKANIPTGRHAAAVASFNNKIYVFGGRDSMQVSSIDKVEEYDPLTDTWSTKTPMPTPRRNAKAVTLNGKIYVLGGSGADVSATNKVEVYDPITDTWETKADMLKARGGHAAVIQNNEIYVFGGTSRTQLAESTERYNPITNTWNIVNSSKPSRAYFAYASIGNNVYAFNGVIFNGTTEVEINSIVKMMVPSPEPVEGEDEWENKRALLVITLVNGIEKEYDLSMKEVNAFIDWYELKQEGTGKASYAIDKHDNNRGPFKSRKDYILFDRILTFEVSEY